MPIKSPFPDVSIPDTDLLTYLFPPSQTPSSQPIWISATCPSESLSPRAALLYVKRLALLLDNLQIPRGDVVLVHTPNHIFVPVAYLGIVGSGRVFSGANPGYTVDEMAHQLRDTGAKAVFAHPSVAKTTLCAAERAGMPKNRIFLFAGRACDDTALGVQDWHSVLPSPQESEHYRWHRMAGPEARSTIATINYSSGTTGLPKGVCISHTNLLANVEQHIFMKYHKKPWTAHSRPDERWLGALPLYHAYGQLWTILMAIRLCVPVYVMEKFQFRGFLSAIEKYKITHLHTAPPMLVMLAKRPETREYNLTSLRDCLCGSAPLSRELQNEVGDRFGMQVVQGWGMTELTCGAMHVPGGVKDDSGSVGQLDPNIECMMLDDTGTEVADGQPGELFVRGPNVCMGYWRNPGATGETLVADPQKCFESSFDPTFKPDFNPIFSSEAASGLAADRSDHGKWLRTGDIAIHRNGWFWIVDRKKELIKVNGLQVAPAELEAVLLEHAGIADAACVGITIRDKDGEEREWPRAYVVVKDNATLDERKIREWMDQKVAKHKRLVGGIVFVREVPKLPSGKIVRKVLREWARRDAEVTDRETARAARL